MAIMSRRIYNVFLLQKKINRGYKRGGMQGFIVKDMKLSG